MELSARLQQVAEASRKVHAERSLKGVVDVLAGECRGLIGAHQVIVSLFDEASRLQKVVSLQLSEKYARWRSYDEQPDNTGIYLLPVETGRVIRLTQAELEAHPRWKGFGAAKDRHPPMRGWLAAPMTTREGRNIGLVQLSDRHEGDFTEKDGLLLDHLAQTGAVAIQNVRLLQSATTAERRLGFILDSSLDLICTLNSEGRFVEVSKSSEAILGYRPEEMIGRAYTEFLVPEDWEAAKDQEAAVKRGEASRTFANRYVRRDGAHAHLHWSSVWSVADEVFYCSVRDMTERAVFEQELSRAQRLDALGKLTGGVAHDFNNLLTIILGSAEALLDELAADPSSLELARLAYDAAERGADLTARLLAFARTQALEPRPFRGDEHLRSLVPILQRALGGAIELDLHACEPAVVLADPAQFEAAVLNLCINARDAMPDGGKLTIEARRADLNGASLRDQGSSREGGFVLISVSDTGAGMSEEVVARAFEPFFTTKPIGKGTGLGLSSVYGFAHQSGGHVELESRIGAGTVVRLYLPWTDDGVAGVAAPVDSPQSMDAAHVLAVEDNDLVRAHVKRQLESLGYRVSTAEDARAALEVLHTTDDIDLLFTDIVMPGGMNGRQLADHARLIWPAMKVLYTSGYTEDSIIRGSRPDAGVLLLRKPYRREDLRAKLAEALESQGRLPQ